MLIEEPREDPKANPRQSTMHEVERVLREAAAKGEGPVSFAEIARRLPARKTRPEVVRAAVRDLVRYKLAVTGSQGVMWVVVDESVWDRARAPLQ